VWVKRKSHLLLFVLYGIQHHDTFLFLSLHLILLFQNIISKIPPLLFLHHNRPCGKRNIKSPPFCKNPPFLSLIASLPKSNPYKYPLSFSLSSFYFSSSSLLPAASNREAPKSESSSSCFLVHRLHLHIHHFNHHQTPPPSTSLHHFVRPATPWDFGRVLLR